MAREHSFTITLSNNRTEKQGVEYLRSQDPRFVLLDKVGRATLVRELKIEKFSRAFDLIYVRRQAVPSGSLTIRSLDSIDLIDVKVTKKKLPRLPEGFFFGATENEFKLGEKLGERYKFCFVSLHPESLGYKMLTAAQVDGIYKNKRIQYQINL